MVQQPSHHNSILNVVGRFLFSLVFLSQGMQVFLTYDKTTGGPLLPIFVAKLDPALAKLTGDPELVKTWQKFYPNVLLTTAIVQCLGAFLFVQNHKFGAALLIVYLASSSLVLHDFWNEAPDTAAQQNQAAHFLKNISLIGGLVCFLASTDGVALKRKREKLE